MLSPAPRPPAEVGSVRHERRGERDESVIALRQSATTTSPKVQPSWPSMSSAAKNRGACRGVTQWPNLRRTPLPRRLPPARAEPGTEHVDEGNHCPRQVPR